MGTGNLNVSIHPVATRLCGDAAVFYSVTPISRHAQYGKCQLLLWLDIISVLLIFGKGFAQNYTFEKTCMASWRRLYKFLLVAGTVNTHRFWLKGHT